MTKIIKNTILDYVPPYTKIESVINPARIYEINSKPIQGNYVVYICERELRAKDNFALNFAIKKSSELNLPLKIIHPKIKYDCLSKQKFIERQLEQTKNIFHKLNLDFEIIEKTPFEIIKYTKPDLLITDFNPILKRNYLKNIDCNVYEIDGHNIIPARYVSNKQEYSAATLRRKIYYNIYHFLTEFENLSEEKVEADFVLKNFIKNKLKYYSEFKNNPYKNVLSGLSKYINLGFISTQRVVLEIIKSDISEENKEPFLEEIIIRKSLADNFCLYTKNFKNFSGIPNWAKFSLNSHRFDIRPYIYSRSDLENAKTHDKLWNSTQVQLIKEGTIHGYLRMYWAKKILEWTISPDEALKIAIYLNDKYGYDSPSANGYAGILWAIGGLHDRAFADYPVSGKIRRMTYESVKRKFNLSDYINKYSDNIYYG